MTDNLKSQLQQLDSKIRQIEQREREIDQRISEFNQLMREQQRLDDESYLAVLQELAHLDRQMSMLSTRAEEQIAKLDLDRDDFGSLITDVGGINTNVSSILNNVGTVDTNVGSALTNIDTITQDVGIVLSKQNQISSAATAAQQRADQAYNKASSAEQTAGQANQTANQAEQTAQQALSEIEGFILTESSFISTTPILTTRGHVHIKAIEPGIRVLRPASYGLLTKLVPETVLERPVKAITEEPLIKIVLPDKISFIATATHRIATRNDHGELRLRQVGDLREGDRLFSYQPMERIALRLFKPVVEIHEVKGFREVFNLRLPHRQFLVDGGVLAH